MTLRVLAVTLVLSSGCTQGNPATAAGTDAALQVPSKPDRDPLNANDNLVAVTSPLGVQPRLRLRSPLSGSLVTSERVEFTWSPAGHARLQLARSVAFEPIVVEYAGEGAIEARLDAGRWFWRVVSDDGLEGSVAWQVWVVPHGKGLVRQGIQYGTDVNGDGLDDLLLPSGVILGHSGPFEGRSQFVRFGLDSGPSALDTRDISDGLGLVAFHPLDSVGVGDVNGDGCADVVAFERGKAKLLFGSRMVEAPWKLRSTNIDVNASAGVRRLGDVNRDGYADVALAALGGWIIFLGSPEGPAPTWSATLGDYTDVAGGGDFDGDGFDDVVAVDRRDRVALIRGGPDGFSKPLAPSRWVDGGRLKRAQNIISVEPRIQLVDVDVDGLADVLGASVPSGVSGFCSFWWVRGQLGVRGLSAPTKRAWPFHVVDSDYSAILWRFLVRTGQAASALLVSNQVPFEDEFLVVPFRGSDLDVSGRGSREEGKVGLHTRVFEALGDFDGDGCDDILERGHPGIGGYTFRIFAGSKSGNGVGQLIAEWFAWGNGGDLAPIENRRWY